jgi:NADH:ubiquinone oxidoreductase subunit 2 (subunit N)
MIQPLAGFIANIYYLLRGLIRTVCVTLFWRLGVAISAFYYCRVVKVMVRIPNQNYLVCNTSVINAYLISTTSLITVLFMAQPDYVTTWLVG